MRTHRKAVVAATAFLVVLLASQARAIPAFARRYKISCSTCHAPFPKLKPYGDEFAGSGFILKEEEKERDYVTAGDDLLWLNKTFPMAVRFDAFGVFDGGNPVKRDFETPFGLKFLSGGNLYKNIGYYFYFFMSEAGEVVGIEDAYLHFDNLFQSGMDVLVGQFQTCDPLMKRELRLSFEDYQVFKYRPGESRTDLTYDRGIVLVYGIEKTQTDLVGMVLNGNGINPADGTWEKFDDDGNKNLGLRVKQGIGSFLSLGGFYYHGKEESLTNTTSNTITYWGPDLEITAGFLDLTVQYLERRDTNPFFQDPAQAYEARGLVVLSTLAPKKDRSRFYLTGLYNYIDSDLEKYHTATLSGTYLVSRNLRLMAEYTRDLEHDVNRFVLGTVSGF